MATEKLITVKKRQLKVVKKQPNLVLVDVKTDGTAVGVRKAIEDLKKEGVSYFEMLDPNFGTKTTFKKLLSGQNYEITTTEIQ